MPVFYFLLRWLKTPFPMTPPPPKVTPTFLGVVVFPALFLSSFVRSQSDFVRLTDCTWDAINSLRNQNWKVGGAFGFRSDGGMYVAVGECVLKFNYQIHTGQGDGTTWIEWRRPWSVFKLRDRMKLLKPANFFLGQTIHAADVLNEARNYPLLGILQVRKP